MAVFEKWYTTDLKKPLTVETIDSVFFTGDEEANLIGVEVLSDGSAAVLSGTVYGYIIRSDGLTVTLTGAISGNRVTITLPATAYYHEGNIDIAIKVDQGNGVVTTVWAGHGYVKRSTSNNYTDIDPDVPIPSLLEILQKIDDCENATAAANSAAEALEDMDATATSLPAGSAPSASVSSVDNHYRISLGIPTGATGATGATPNISIGTVSTLEEGEQATATITGTPTAPVLNLGIPVGATGATGDTGATGATGQNGANATITNQATQYQTSNSGSTIPTGVWLDNIPTVPQGSYLWIRCTITWNSGVQTTLYSVSRNGVDGSGSVASVNGYSPDGNGNVDIPLDIFPQQGGLNPITSGGVYAALVDKQDVLTFDQLPASASTNPVTSGGIYSAMTYKVDKAGDTMTGALNLVAGSAIIGDSWPSLDIKTNSSTTVASIIFRTNVNKLAFQQRHASNAGYFEQYNLPDVASNLSSNVNYEIITSKGGNIGGLLNLTSPTIDMTTTPSSEVVYDPLYVLDKNGATIGHIRCRQNTTNGIQLELNARRVINGATIFNGLQLGVGTDRSRWVTFSDPAAWRTGLGLSVLQKTASVNSTINGQTQLYVYTSGISGYTCISAWFEQTANDLVMIVSSPFKATNGQVLARIYNPNTTSITATGTMHFIFVQSGIIGTAT